MKTNAMRILDRLGSQYARGNKNYSGIANSLAGQSSFHRRGVGRDALQFGLIPSGGRDFCLLGG
jgi:hypothetical protein